MTFRNVRTLAFLAVFGFCCLIQSRAEHPVSPVHLVGHEDLELLDRVQDLIDDWDPRKLVNPLVETTQVLLPDGTYQKRKQLKRSDLTEFIADVEAAEVLGKALFWDMQAGSDFRRTNDGVFIGTACASCHYQYGADPRTRHAARIPFIVWDQYKLHPEHDQLKFNEKQLPFDPEYTATHEYSHKDENRFGFLAMIVGSAGVEPRIFEGLSHTDPLNQGLDTLMPGEPSEKSRRRTLDEYPENCFPQWSMFIKNERSYRQITERNSPTTINAVFSDRLFHDGRAESTFNGFSIFGGRDQNPVLHRGVAQRDEQGRIIKDEKGNPVYGKPVQVHVALTKAALASQAVGPVVNDVEMSYLGRSFPNLACKLLDAKVLAFQEVKSDDSILGTWQDRIGKEATQNSKCMTYRQLIQQAFRREWWDTGTCKDKDGMLRDCEVPLVMMGDAPEDRASKGPIIVANFSLYWGLSVMLYEATLVSNQSPFDAMMQGNPKLVEERWKQEQPRFGTLRLDQVLVEPKSGEDRPIIKTGTAAFQYGFRVFMNRGCLECHSGPLFSELYERHPEDEKFPIYHRLANTLLPNSRSDAIAIERHEFHRTVLKRVETILTEAPMSLPQDRAAILAKKLDVLRESARGNLDSLKRLVEDRLHNLGGTAQAGVIAEEMMRFEKNSPLHYGNRLFFTEEERLDLAEQIVESVLVELMPITPKQAQERLRVPIQGPLTPDAYAFYDSSFYALGLSPPRYDRGIGARQLEQLAEAPLEIQLDLVLRRADLMDQLANSAKLKAVDDKQKPLPIRNATTRKDIRDEIQRLRTQKIPTEGTLQEKVQKLNISAALEKELLNQVGLTKGSQANSGARGKAYDIRPQYRSIEQFELRPAERVAEAEKVRLCHEGPSYDLEEEEKLRCQEPDNTWDRIDIPENVRRSSLLFWSRARTLVTDEEPWGFRKPFLHDNELAYWGAFKTPTLRNVELTAPFMHNGRLESLEDVIEFYDDGGFLELNKEDYPDKHPEIISLDMSKHDRLALEFFLICLTDERVRREQAPFDHPSLEVVHGCYQDFRERIVTVPAVGAGGRD